MTLVFTYKQKYQISLVRLMLNIFKLLLHLLWDMICLLIQHYLKETINNQPKKRYVVLHSSKFLVHNNIMMNEYMLHCIQHTLKYSTYVCKASIPHKIFQLTILLRQHIDIVPQWARKFKKVQAKKTREIK